MQKVVNFQTEEFVPAWAADYPEKKFTVFSTCFLSTKENSHELNISEEVLRRDASSILGNFLVAKLEYGDAKAHHPDEIIYGYFPKEQEIEFDTTEEGIVKAKAYCVISKMYGSEFNSIFSTENFRNTSVEMTVNVGEDEHEVLSFDIYGLTCLGTTVKGSCPDANMSMVRFSEEEAENFFKEESSSSSLRRFAQDRKDSMNKEFFAKTEDPEGDSVTNKVEDERKEGESKMSEIEFAAVEISDLWGKLYDALHIKYPDGDYGSVYRIEGIYEENAQKFAVICKRDEDTLYRLNFSMTEEGMTLEDEITKVEIAIVETDEVRKFAEPEDVEKYKVFASVSGNTNEEPMAKLEQPAATESVDELLARIAKLETDIADKDNIIMQNTVELEELRTYKNTCMEVEKATKVETVMSEVEKFMDKDCAESYRKKGMACEFSAIDAWANEVKASIVDKVVKSQASESTKEEFTRMSGVTNIDKKTGTALDRLKAQYCK